MNRIDTLTLKKKPVFLKWVLNQRVVDQAAVMGAKNRLKIHAEPVQHVVIAVLWEIHVQMCT